MAEGEGTGEGSGTGAGTGQTASPAWVAQLPDDLKANETFTSYKTIGDLGKAHLDVMGKVKELDGVSAKVKDLEGKLGNSVPKLSANPTAEEVSAYYSAIGRPGKPDEYEFPQVKGQESDPNMIKWAQGVFFKNGLTKEQAKGIGQEWNAFVAGVVESEEKLAEQERATNEKKFREQFKSEDEYKSGYELSKRFWNKVTGTDFDAVYKEAEAWQVPTFMSFIFNVAKMTGEDTSPLGRSSVGGVKEGMVYDKSPPPPKT